VQDITLRSEDQERPPPGPGDYFVIQTRESWFFVSTFMARAIQSQLGRFIRPRWITFVDVVGACVRVRSDRIVTIVQSAAEQRASIRVFDRMRELEGNSE